MKTFPKNLILAFFLTFFVQVVWGQFWTENFTSGTYTVTLGGEGNDGTADYFQTTDGSNIGISYTGNTGNFFAAQDVDDGGWTGSADPSQLTWSGINISGYSNLEFSGIFASAATDKIDAADYVLIEYQIDGGGWNNLLAFENDGSTYNTEFGEDTDFDGNSDGADLSATFSSFTKSITGTGSSLDLRITVSVNSGDEDFAFDTFQISGTGGSSNDTDSQVSASSTLTEPATISSLQTSANGVQVFDFTFTDLATADGLATIIDQLQITQGNNNGIADWTNAIAGAVLNGPDQTNMTGTVNATNITFAADDMISIANGGNETYTLSIWLNTDLSGITDNDILEFAMDYTNITEDATGSSFGTGAPESGDANVAIDIDAVELRFSTNKPPASASLSSDFAVEVSATDANGNTDTDATNSVTLSKATGTGTLTSVAGLTKSLVSGVYEWTDAQFDATGIHTITATTTGLDNNTVTSGNIDITETPQLIISEIADPDDSYKGRFVELYNAGTTTIDFDTDDWWLMKHVNAGTSHPEIQLTGSVAAGATYVIAAYTDFTTYYNPQTYDLLSTVADGNGDDGYHLYKDDSYASGLGTLVDIYGVLDVDGSGEDWEYENSRAVRDCGTSPNTTWTASEWTITSADVADMDPGEHCVTCSEPTTNATTMTFSSVTTTSMTVGWTDGNGANRIVVAKSGSAPDWTPVDANTYSANASFGTGTELGTGNYVVYNGTGSTVDITNLVGGTTYYFTVYEYNCSPGSEDYLVDEDALTDDETTLLSNVQNLSASCITNTSATLNWDAPAGSYDSIFVTVRQGAIPSDPSCEGQWLTSASTVYTSATTYCGNSTDSRYVYNGTGNTVTVTALTNDNSYTFKVFTYQGSDWSSGTQITKTIDLVDVSNANATRGNAEVDLSWTIPANCFDEIMIVAEDTTTNNTISASPTGDGSLYTANSVFGTGGSGANLPSNEYCVYKGTGTNLTVTGLTNGNTYEFKIFVRKGTEWTEGVSIFEKPLDITIMNQGDLMIMAVNTSYDNDPVIDANQPEGEFEEFTFVCFKDIKVGTSIDFTDNGWERQYSGYWGTTEGTIRLTRESGDGDLSAGKTVTVVMNSGNGNGGSGTDDTDFDIFVGGVDELAAGYWSITELNTSDGSGFNLNGEDDIWIMQNGSWIENTTGGAPDPAYHDDEYTGNILFGWTATGWPGADAAGSTAFSNLYPYSDCFQTDISGASNNDKVKYSGAMTSATQLEWIARVNDTGNWTTYSSDALYDATTTNLYRQSGVTIPITSGGYTDGVWTGTQNTDWFDCGNWQSLTVPDENVDVVIGASATDNAVVDDASAEASKYDGIAKCRDLTISNQTLFIEGDVSDTLMVYGNLEISGGTLDMDDAAKAIDGHLYLYGNWDNQSGSANFKEGEGTVHFVGNGSQSISTSDATETFYNFISDNSIVSGIILNDDVRIDGAFSHTDGEIDLNGNNIDLRSTYSRTTGTFIGDASSDFSLNGSGSVADLSFINDLNLHDFTINRAGENVVILSDLYLNNLTITAGSVTLTAGKNYDVDGTLTNTPNTAAALILKSDASGTASLIQQTGAVSATVERYLSGDNWHYIFAPLTSIDTAIFTVAPWGDINPNVYFYNETVADFWQGLTVYNPTGWTGVNSDYMQTDRGYINYFTADKVYTQTGGNLTDADKSFTLSYTDNGPGNEPTTGTAWSHFDGWNLFGNPYVSAVDWDNAGLNKDSIENFIYYYDDTQDKYLCYGGNPPWDNNGVSINGGTQYIPAGQAFMIKSSSTANGNPFIIPKTARVHNSYSFYKKSSEFQNLIRLQIKKDNYTDETIIRTLPAETNVTDEHDANYDAYKMFAWNSENPQLYSHTPENDEFFAVNSIPEIASSEVVPLGLYIGAAGEYSVEMTENTFGNMHMWLEDRTENVNTNLLNNSIYTFNQSAETNDNRFYLHFGENTKPKLNAEIPDQEINVNDTYDYVIQPGLFTDTDFEDVLTYTATLENGDVLPDWLSFIPETQSFYGTPAETQILSIKVTATDIFGASVSDVYTLTVKSSSSVNDYTEGTIQIFPNPAKDKLNIVVSDFKGNGEISIFDITGKKVLSKEVVNKKDVLDISLLTQGIYIIEIKLENKLYKQRIVKE